MKTKIKYILLTDIEHLSELFDKNIPVIEKIFSTWVRGMREEQQVRSAGQAEYIIVSGITNMKYRYRREKNFHRAILMEAMQRHGYLDEECNFINMNN